MSNFPCQLLPGIATIRLAEALMKNDRIKNSLKCAFFLLVLCGSIQAHSYLTLGESGDVTPRDTLKLGFEPQLRISDGGAANFSLFLDAAIKDDLSWRAQIGTGETDLYAGGSIKWIPIPDFEKQPALGLRTDVYFGREMDETFWSFRLAPLISKRVDSDYILFSPYLSPTLGYGGTRGRSETFSQLIIGTEIRPHDMDRLVFDVELGSNLSKSFSYISFNVVYLLESANKSQSQSQSFQIKDQ